MDALRANIEISSFNRVASAPLMKPPERLLSAITNFAFRQATTTEAQAALIGQRAYPERARPASYEVAKRFECAGTPRREKRHSSAMPRTTHASQQRITI